MKFPTTRAETVIGNSQEFSSPKCFQCGWKSSTDSKRSRLKVPRRVFAICVCECARASGKYFCTNNIRFSFRRHLRQCFGSFGYSIINSCIIVVIMFYRFSLENGTLRVFWQTYNDQQARVPGERRTPQKETSAWENRISFLLVTFVIKCHYQVSVVVLSLYQGFSVYCYLNGCLYVDFFFTAAIVLSSQIRRMYTVFGWKIYRNVFGNG